jgi:hypothetical protein
MVCTAVVRAYLPYLTDITIVNELSGTMDLESTLVRAESLFKRFQRTVETIDKKGNFPSAPQARQRIVKAATTNEPDESASHPKVPVEAEASSSGTDNNKPLAKEEEPARVISPELRALLSKKVEKLDKQDVAKAGGGVSS